MENETEAPVVDPTPVAMSPDDAEPKTDAKPANDSPAAGLPPIPVGIVPFNAMPVAFLVFPIPGAIATNRAGEQVKVYAVQIHTPSGVNTYATDEKSIQALGDQCRQAVGPGISIAPANALEMLAGRMRRR